MGWRARRMSLEGALNPRKCLLLSPQERWRIGTDQPGDVALPSGSSALLLSVPLTQASPSLPPHPQKDGADLTPQHLEIWFTAPSLCSLYECQDPAIQILTTTLCDIKPVAPAENRRLIQALLSKQDSAHFIPLPLATEIIPMASARHCPRQTNVGASMHKNHWISPKLLVARPI